jgi:hypothetical protein
VTNIHPYLLQHSPQCSPLYKQKTSNVHLNVHLNSIYKENNVHLINKTYDIVTFCHDNNILVNVGVNVFNRRKQLFFSCFSTEVNVALRVGERWGEHCFWNISRSKIPCMGERYRFFAHVYMFFDGRISCNSSLNYMEVLN